MKKTVHQRAAICAGLSILLLADIAHAEAAKPQPSVGATKPAQVDRAFYPKNPHLLELEKQLGQVILASQPDAKIEFIANYLVVSYRSEKYAPHLTDGIGIISTEAPERFPNDFSEFQLYLSVNKDVMYYRPENIPGYIPQTFGTTFGNRYNLGMLADNLRPPNDSPDVPREHWAYNQYDKLSKAGLLPKRFPEGFWSGPYTGMMTRYEFAVAIARLTDKFQRNAQAANKNPDTKNALTALQQEFVPEMTALGFHLETNKAVINGQTWLPRYEYLLLEFTYGKGIDTTLRDKIKQIIADYVNARIKPTTSTSNVSAQK